MRRDRIHFSAGVAAGLLLVSALFVVSRTALAQTAAGSFQSVSGQVQISARVAQPLELRRASE